MAEIVGENKKALGPDRFCLTGPVPRSYFAGSPPSACGGKEAAITIPCGMVVNSVGPPGDERWIVRGW